MDESQVLGRLSVEGFRPRLFFDYSTHLCSMTGDSGPRGLPSVLLREISVS